MTRTWHPIPTPLVSAGSSGLVVPGVLSPIGDNAGHSLPYPLVDPAAGYQLVKDGAVGDYNAFPGAVKNGAGIGITVWRHGVSHSNNEGAIWISRSDKNWQNWSAPTQLLAVATRDLRDVALSRLRDGRIALTAFASIGSTSASRPHSEFVGYSTDDGQTFTFDTASIAAAGGPGPDQFTQYCRCSGAILDLGNGLLLWPVHGQNTGDSGWTTAVLISSDNGVTWPTQVTIHTGGGGDFQECNLALCADGSVLAASRNNNNTTFLAGSTGAIHFARLTNITGAGATVADLGPLAVGIGRPNLLVSSLTGWVYLFTRRPNGERAVWSLSKDNGATWAFDPGGLVNGSAGALAPLDSRLEDDGTTAVRYTYAQATEVAPGLIAVALSVERHTGSDAQIVMRYIAERPAVTPAGSILGPAPVFDGRWDGNLPAFQSPNGQVYWVGVGADGRLFYSATRPTSDTDTAKVFIGHDQRQYVPIAAPATLSAIPSAVTKVAGTERYFDLSGMKTFLFSADVATAAASGAAVLKVQYTTDITGATGWTDLTATGIALNGTSVVKRQPTSTGSDGLPTWSSIPTAARTQVRLRLVTSGGDGAAGATVGAVAMMARAIA